MDINSDGLTDCVDTSLGCYCLNTGENSFVEGKIGGQVTFRDFNNDGLPDYHWRNSSGYTDQNDTIYENTGDWRTFVAHPIDNIGFFPSDN